MQTNWWKDSHDFVQRNFPGFPSLAAGGQGRGSQPSQVCGPNTLLQPPGFLTFAKQATL